MESFGHKLYQSSHSKLTSLGGWGAGRGNNCITIHCPLRKKIKVVNCWFAVNAAVLNEIVYQLVNCQYKATCTYVLSQTLGHSRFVIQAIQNCCGWKENVVIIKKIRLERHFQIIWTKPGLFLFLFLSFLQFNNKFSTVDFKWKIQMMCLGFEPGTAGWKAQTNPLCHESLNPFLLEENIQSLSNSRSVTNLITNLRS